MPSPHLLFTTIVIMRIRHILFALIMTVPAAMHLHADGYKVNFPADATISTARSLQTVILSSPTDGTQSVAVNQQDDLLLYHDCTNRAFCAVAGEPVIASFGWTGNWMHGYVYLDRDNDGGFSYQLGQNSSIPGGSDVMAFSNYDNYNSEGASTGNGNVGVNPPGFIIPDLPAGLYRMRYKVDWNSIDPGGNDANGAVHQQLITTNGGAITDVLVYIHPKTSGLTVVSEHGTVTGYNGKPADGISLKPGKDLGLVITPEQGWHVESVTVTSGYSLDVDNVTLASPQMTASKLDIPAYWITDNTLTVPGANTYGAVTVTVNYGEGAGSAISGNYESELDGSKESTDGLTSLSLAYGSTTSTATFGYTDCHATHQSHSLHLLRGASATAVAAYSGFATAVNLYVDLNQDGNFNAGQGELLASAAPGQPLAFDLPSIVKAGVYRGRIEAEGHCDVDFPLNIHESMGEVNASVINGYVTGASAKALVNRIAYGTAFTVTVCPTLPGFEAASATVRHGHNLTGPQYVRGNRQWDETVIPVGAGYKLSSAVVDGDILITADFAETPGSEWTAIWSDEFGDTEMDETKWICHDRRSATWNKLIATGDEIPYVNNFDNGCYQSYCIATPSEFTSEPKEMISGAICTHGKFHMTHGRIEARLRTRAHTGNFPAFWLMPTDQSAGWPKCGEIDIWEQIDDQKTAHHTVHTAWTYKSFGEVSQSSPQSTGNETNDGELWHVYALEWDAEQLNWYVDGVLRFTYTNPHFSEGQYTEEMTWPFNKSWYVILNQSVGDGSWARPYDRNFEYLTEFDYVRAYQRKDALNYYSTASGTVGIEPVETEAGTADAPVIWFDMQGRQVSGHSPAPGIYIRRQGAVASKLMVR